MSEDRWTKIWEAFTGDPMDPKNNTEAGLRRVVEVMLENASTPSPSTHVAALGLLKEAIQSVEESMAADAPDGETVDPAHYDVVIPYEDAKQILAGLTPPPQTNVEGENRD